MKWVAELIVDRYDEAGTTLLTEEDLLKSVDARDGEIKLGLRRLSTADILARRNHPHGVFFHYHDRGRTNEVLESMNQ